jgi:formylglycine-generating enzyme required for sulfatase activity
MFSLFSSLFSGRAAALISAVLISGALPGVAADPVVSNLKAVQREGTKLVDITYDVAADTPTVRVNLQISGDGGVTFAVPAVSVTGAVGAGVSTGTGKALTWNAGTDWNGQYSSQVRFKVVADDAPPGFASIPAGSFLMGDSFGEGDSDERPVRQVTVSAFYMGRTEVAKGEWDEVRAWAATHGYTDLSAGAGKAANHPVQTVSWWDAIKWCNARSEKEGLVPCYAVSGSPMRTGTTVPTVNWTAKGYRLPTEAEWEKAARGGLSGKRFPWGDTISHSQANYYSSSSYAYDVSPTRGHHPSYGVGAQPYTSPAGSFAANAYGLQDMAGNVWEWCWDWYGTYVSGAQSDPRGAGSGSSRVNRGGSWGDNANYCRAANRSNNDPAYQYRNLGFRVLRSSVP